MALKDVKSYYYSMLNQYLEMKADVTDYDKAFVDGHITEDQLEELKSYISDVEQNYQRLAYIMYLFELPNRKSKKEKYKKSNKKLTDTFDNINASDKAVVTENTSTISQIKAELEKLKSNK